MFYLIGTILMGVGIIATGIFAASWYQTYVKRKNIVKKRWKGLVKRQIEREEAELNETAEEYLENLNQLLATDRVLIKDLKQFENEIKQFQQGLVVTRKASTTAKLVGGIYVLGGTCLIPFSGGLSSVFITVGTGAILGGRITDVIRRWIDSSATQEHMRKLRMYAEQHDQVAKKLDLEMNKFVDLLGLSAKKNIKLSPTRATLTVMVFAYQAAMLAPNVRDYVQSYVSSFWGKVIKPEYAKTVMSTTQGVVVLLNAFAAVCTIIECIYEIKEIEENKPHPSQVKVNEFIELLNEEIKQLNRRKSLVEEEIIDYQNKQNQQLMRKVISYMKPKVARENSEPSFILVCYLAFLSFICKISRVEEDDVVESKIKNKLEEKGFTTYTLSSKNKLDID